MRASLIMRKYKSKPQWVIPLYLSGCLLSIRKEITNAGNCGEKGILLYCQGERKLYSLYGKFNKRISKIKIPYGPTIPLLGIHKLKTRFQRDICIPMFITVLFTIVNRWERPQVSMLMNEWLNKMGYICSRMIASLKIETNSGTWYNG